jgi:hypothetical protein
MVVELGRPAECIYCWTDENLTDEHVVPYAVDGEWVLRDASCRNCAQRINRFETRVLRNELLVARSKMDAQTRRPENRPKTFPLRVERESCPDIDIELPVDEHPAPVHFPIFEPPGYIVGQDPSDEIGFKGIQSAVLDPEALQDVLNDHGVEEGETIGVRGLSFKPFPFAQQAGKVAHGFAVAKVGLDNLKEPFVVPTRSRRRYWILGRLPTC